VTATSPSTSRRVLLPMESPDTVATHLAPTKGTAPVQITVKFTDVYDGQEYPRTETFDVPAPTGDLDEWADEHLRPRTGSNVGADESGYFAEIATCSADPGLVGREFSWDV
jgi:hypothetical protein